MCTARQSLASTMLLASSSYTTETVFSSATPLKSGGTGKLTSKVHDVLGSRTAQEAPESRGPSRESVTETRFKVTGPQFFIVMWYVIVLPGIETSQSTDL